MLTCRRLRQLQELAGSHPHYFRHNYYKELANAGYEEVVPDATTTSEDKGPTGHGKKVLTGASLIKAKPQTVSETDYNAGKGVLE